MNPRRRRKARLRRKWAWLSKYRALADAIRMVGWLSRELRNEPVPRFDFDRIAEGLGL